ncbi:MAG: hypothetical protein IPG58_15740 [Acidobacteria bacterium]|nr:hypothetical protein [Acidobacteriota bacterium]
MGTIDMQTKSEIEIEDELWNAIASARDTPDAKFLTHEEMWNSTMLSDRDRDTLLAILDGDAEPSEGLMAAAAIHKQLITG